MSTEALALNFRSHRYRYGSYEADVWLQDQYILKFEAMYSDHSLEEVGRKQEY